MRSFTANTIRNMLRAGEDSEDRARIFNMLLEDEDSRFMMIAMLSAQPLTVEKIVEKRVPVYCEKVYEANCRYNFIALNPDMVRKIDAIKLVRQATRIGLKEAKDLVEGMIFRGFPELFEQEMRLSLNGCGYWIEKAQ